MNSALMRLGEAELAAHLERLFSELAEADGAQNQAAKASEAEAALVWAAAAGRRESFWTSFQRVVHRVVGEWYPTIGEYGAPTRSCQQAHARVHRLFDFAAEHQGLHPYKKGHAEAVRDFYRARAKGDARGPATQASAPPAEAGSPGVVSRREGV